MDIGAMLASFKKNHTLEGGEGFVIVDGYKIPAESAETAFEGVIAEKDEDSDAKGDGKLFVRDDVALNAGDVVDGEWKIIEVGTLHESSYVKEYILEKC